MSFTEDELQAFKTVLERALVTHRREMEHSFDQRMQVLRRDVDQRLTNIQQEIVRTITRQLSNQQNSLNGAMNQKIDTQQKHVTQMVSRQTERSQQHIEDLMDQLLAAQLLCIDQLVNQRFFRERTTTIHADNHEYPSSAGSEAVQTQTDFPWYGLTGTFNKVLDTRFSALNASIQATMKDWEQYLSADVFDKVLDTRFSALNDIIQATMKDWEQYLSADVFDKVLDTRFSALNDMIQATMKDWEQYIALRLQNLREQAQAYNENLSSIPTTQDLFAGIEHLERMIEAMQVAMTANYSLLSTRQLHHQQLSLERAHPASNTLRTTLTNGLSDPVSPSTEDRDANGESTEAMHHQE